MSSQNILDNYFHGAPQEKRAKLSIASPNLDDVLPSTSQNSRKRSKSSNSQHKNKVFKRRNGIITYNGNQHDSDDSDDSPADKSSGADVGIIEKITLRNFMCHSHLEFKLGPNVNFIVGRNGSGKSAVVNGLMLALGSRSSLTGRAANLAGFIQTNKQFAVITVMLRNYGVESYQPENYGNYISIERRINLNGQSSYKLLSHDGKVISTKRDDLNQILDAFNIQVDNPVGILTQEASKSFLESRDPKKRYELFLKATNLERLKEEYSEVESRRKTVFLSLKAKEEMLPEAEKEVEKHKQQLRKVERCFSQKDKISQLNSELAWVEVRDAEMLEEKQKQEYDELSEKINRDLQSIKKLEERIGTIGQKLTEFKKEEENLKSKIGNEHDNFKKISNQCREIDMDITRKMASLQSMKSNMNRIQSDITRLQCNIDELNQRSQEDLDRQTKKREMQIRELEFKKNKISAAYDALNDKVTIYENGICVSEKNIFGIGREVENLIVKKRNSEYDFRTMLQGLKNQAILYGPKMPQLLAKIQSERRRFRKLPIGPIGMHLKIKDPKWSFAIEMCLTRGFLTSFCCDNDEDMRTLKKIMMEIYGKDIIPSIITCRFTDKVYSDISQMTPKNYPSICDIVTSDNPVIDNCLIDNKSVESILLVEDRSTAINVMMNSPPKGCKSCYTPDGDQIFPVPNYRYYSCKLKQNSRPLLQRYDSNDIKNMQTEIKKCEEGITKLRQDKERENETLQQQKNDFARVKTEQNNLKKQMLHLSKQIEGIDSETTNQLDISALVNELETQESSFEKTNLEHSTLTKEIEDKKNNLKVLKEEKEALENSCNKIKKDWDLIEKKILELEQEKAKYMNHKTHSNAKHKSMKQQLPVLEEKYKEVKKNTETLLQKTLKKFPERINSRRKAEDLRSQIAEIQSAVNEHLRDVDVDKLRKKVGSKLSTVSKIKKDIEYLLKNIEKLKKELRLRDKKYTEIRRYMSVRVSYLFELNMKSRAYNGQLHFLHNEGSLVVSAEPASKSISDNMREIFSNTNCLSGGERSFVSVALLLALSDVSEIPFHILDEYDVFMDAMNKELSLKMMLEKADEQKSNQFIFLSPLDLPPSAFKHHHLVKIHKMKDPERGGLS